MSWVCPKCLSTNSNTLKCICGLSINEDLLDNFRENMTPAELLKDIDSHSFIGARDRVELLKYYLVKRFPESDEAKKTGLFVDTTSASALDNYFSQHTFSLKQQNLIYCPDCNASVSKRAVTCPHCGCPIADIIASTPELVQPATSTFAKPIQDNVVQTNENYHASIPRCPTCGSTNVEKISLKSKAGKVLLVGVFAIGRVAKSYKCNNCRHQW